MRFLTIFIVVLAVMAAVLGISYAVGKYFAKNYLLGGNEQEVQVDINSENTIAVEIPQGSSTKDIAAILKENGIIGSEISFRLKSKMNGADASYNYGTYYLSKDMSADQIIKVLQGVSQAETTNKITIPEGFTAQKIASLLDEKGIVTGEDFLNEMNYGVFEYDFLDGIPKRDNYLEGYLFPDTYFLSGNETAHDIIVLMLNRFDQVYNSSLKDSVALSGRTLDEIVNVAAMVESEAKADDERPIIAGVIYNRLAIDMALQIDSTVQYALSTRNEVVTLNDLEVDSPYNTYKNKGLPAGPICNPGEASLIAACNPSNHNYYYYVLKEQGGSEHTFTENYDDFLKAKAEYQATFSN
ncbi:endolytic murein transglycosylase [Clostridiales bacterium]|nr:endolytic murein transglycosylase [Clostridiales bacterium]